MRLNSVISSLLCALAVVENVLASQPLATYSPCPSCPKSVMPPAITITKELQEVSTCTASKTFCETHTKTHTSLSSTHRATEVDCSTEYYYSTYEWVSTVIPLPYPPGKTVVTKTEENVTINHISTQISHYTTITPPVPSPTFVVWKNATNTTRFEPVVKPSPYTVLTYVDVVVIDYIVEFAEIGPLAIPGYEGPGICTDCTRKPDGSVTQVVEVHKCVNSKCSDYKETWAWAPPKTTTTTTVVSSSTSVVCPTPGTYTATIIPQTCVTTTVTVAPGISWTPTTISYRETSVVCPTPGVYTATLTSSVCTTTTVSPPAGTPWSATTVPCETVITLTYTETITECETIVSGTTMPPASPTCSTCPNGVSATSTTTTTTVTSSTTTTPASQTSQSGGTTSSTASTTSQVGPVSGTTSTTPIGSQTSQTGSTSSSSSTTSTASTTSQVGPVSGTTTTSTTSPASTTSQVGPVSGTTTTTTTTSGSSTTSSTSTTSTGSTTSSAPNPDPSSDMEPEEEPVVPPQARALDYHEMPNNVVRRGGLFRSRKRVDEEAAERLAQVHKRDFGIKPTGLLS